MAKTRKSKKNSTKPLSEEDPILEALEFEPTPEEIDNLNRYRKEVAKYPLVSLIVQLATRRNRLLRLKALEAPEVIIKSASDSVERTLDELCTAIPFDNENREYHLSWVFKVLFNEVNESDRFQGKNLDG